MSLLTPSDYLFPLRFVCLLWLVKLIEPVLFINLAIFGIIPRTIFGLIGIVAAPMIHGNYYHLLANSIPLFVLGTTLFWLYRGVAHAVFFYCYFITNFLVWIFGRPYIHIGASGLLYGIALFLMTIGLFKKDLKSIGISLVVAILYSGMIWGVFPTQPGVSWESHFWGAVVGVCCASVFSKSRYLYR
jgi:membrane associated rhomboid family serine protease